MQRSANPAPANFLHDRPALYDAMIPDPDQQMGRFIHAILQRYGAGQRVLDIGCGLGREVGYLCERGYMAVGLDNSAAMVAWAQRHYPAARFVTGSQDSFDLGERFDAITCMGSTFLYNATNELLQATLGCIHRHLMPGGLLLLDMRNAAFFLTGAGQEWLRREHHDVAVVAEGPLAMTTRFEIDVAAQLLKRAYTWTLAAEPPLHELLDHRLIFPQELRLLLSTCGFEVCAIFDTPAPHIGEFDVGDDFVLGQTMTGRRMQAIARALPTGEQP